MALPVVETIGEHAATGVDPSSRVSVLGASGSATKGRGTASNVRHIHVTGIAGGSIVKIQGSLDNSSWVDWITGIDANSWYVVPDGPLYMRSNCTTYGSGTVTVKVQKFTEE
jgi:hypothetical protein